MGYESPEAADRKLQQQNWRLRCRLNENVSFPTTEFDDTEQLAFQRDLFVAFGKRI